MLLLGLAIVDDVGAIIVIAVFYSDGIDGALARRGRRRPASWSPSCAGPGCATCPSTSSLGTGIWLATFESGVHATIAGVALGLLAPARPFLPEVDADRIADELSADQAVTAAEVRDISFRVRESVPVTERLQDLLHPWTSYLIVPVFALANAGVAVSADSLGDAAVLAGHPRRRRRARASASSSASPAPSPSPSRLGIGRLPDGVTTRHVVGHGRHRRHRVHRVDLRRRPRLRRSRTSPTRPRSACSPPPCSPPPSAVPSCFEDRPSAPVVTPAQHPTDPWLQSTTVPLSSMAPPRSPADP